MGITLKGLASKVKSGAKKVASKIAKPNGPNSGISNVLPTLKAAVTGKVQSNTGNSTIDKVLSTAASHPFVVSAVAGTVANAVKFAPAVTRAVKSKVKGSKSKNVTATQSSDRPGMLDVDSLGKSSVTSAPGMVTPSGSSGGILAKPTTTTSSSGATSRTSTTKRRAKSKKRTASKARRKSRSKSKKKHYGSAKQYARPGGKSVKYTKNRQPYIILSDGRARFIKKR